MWVRRSHTAIAPTLAPYGNQGDVVLGDPIPRLIRTSGITSCFLGHDNAPSLMERIVIANLALATC